MSALKEQVQGTHYKSLAIQPVEYIHKNKLGFCEGSVVKYVTRWREKNGLEDLKKAKHFIELLMEMEGHGNTRPVEQGKTKGEWVKVFAPSQMPRDLAGGDEIEDVNAFTYVVKHLDDIGYGGYTTDGRLMHVELDEITAYRRNS